jgi:hypothetical protein
VKIRVHRARKILKKLLEPIVKEINEIWRFNIEIPW